VRFSVPTASIIDRAIGIRLQAERLARQVDSACFAESVGVTPEKLEAFETGFERIDARTMVEICRRLDVGIRHFFESEKAAWPVAAE
jgi:DNA-binding Xre family transcriptional regulator